MELIARKLSDIATDTVAPSLRRTTRRLLKGMAGTTGFEPATSDVTGRRSNQTELRPRLRLTSVNITTALPVALRASLVSCEMSLEEGLVSHTR